MGVFRPIETRLEDSVVPACGLFVEVTLVGTTNKVMHAELDDSDFAKVVSTTGEGLYVVDPESTEQITRVVSVASKLSCRQCGLCDPKDFSVDLATPRFVSENEIPGLEANYAEGVIEISGARQIAFNCVTARTRGQEV